MFEEEAASDYVSDEPRSYESLLGLQIITAISAQYVLGLDGVLYRTCVEGLYELTDVAIARLEVGININRLNPPRIVEFRVRPDLETVLYAIDEKLDAVVIEIGRRPSDRWYDRNNKERPLEFFLHYKLSGYTPTWFKRGEATTFGPYR